MTSTSDNVILKLQQFLQRLRQGDFTDELPEAFRQLNMFLETYEIARSYLLHNYLPQLYLEGRTGQQHLMFFAVRTLEDDAPGLAQVLISVLIGIYIQHEDEEFLKIFFELLLKYRLAQFISIEGGQNLRVASDGKSFAVPIASIHPDFRLELLQLVLKKYVSLLVTTSLPEPQDFPSVIQRLNAVIGLLRDFDSSKLIRRTALVPFTLDYIRYAKQHATQLFAHELTALEYDEWLFTNYRIPLFPFIESDKLSFTKNKITFTNEGLGSLPSATIRVQVGEEEFEIGELSRFIAPDEVYDLFLEEIPEFLGFLKRQSPNLDIKVIFSFKKFSRSYDFGIVAKSVGHWLEQIPPSSWELVQPYEIPLEKLNEKEFERLCCWVIEADPRFTDVLWLNEDGGGERGRDVLAVEIATGEHYVFQCKHVKQFGPSNIKEELTIFAQYVADDPSIKPDVYVLFISMGITDKVKVKGDELAQQIGMKIKYWPKSKIDRLVRTNKDIKERFGKLVSE